MLPLFVAEKQGYFKAQGITVTFVPAQSAAERDQLMQAGQIDGMNNDMVSTVLYNKDSVKIKVVRRRSRPRPPGRSIRSLRPKIAASNLPPI
jgi:NitT/TauT family transport system substrate-binding protein